MKERIRILLADDHPVVRDGLKGMIASQEDLEVVGEAADGEELLRLAERLKADVALVHGQGGIMSSHCTLILGRERGT